MLRIFLIRQKQHHAIPVQNQIKIFQIASVLHHIAIVIIFKTTDAVEVYSGYSAVMEQTLFLIHAVAPEYLNGFVGRHIPLHDRNLCCHILLHFCFDPVHQLLRFLKISVRLNKQAIGNRILHRYLADMLCPHDLIEGL